MQSMALQPPYFGLATAEFFFRRTVTRFINVLVTEGIDMQINIFGA